MLCPLSSVELERPSRVPRGGAPPANETSPAPTLHKSAASLRSGTSRPTSMASLGDEVPRGVRLQAHVCIDMYMLIEARVKSLDKPRADARAVGEIVKRILSHPMIAVWRVFRAYFRAARRLFPYRSAGIFLFASMRPFIH